ncbi:MAG: SpoIIE family protein phosphatase [Spirochaetes bacterium]|nr:SpoIIE family protein phosphatase [Spirochaetota bacterium]
MNLIDLLKNISVFNNISEDNLNKIIPLLKEIYYDTGQKIINEGDSGNSMYVLVKGSVKVIKKGDNNEEILISYLYPGSYFGELSLIDNLPRSASVISNEQTEMLFLSKNDFDSLLLNNYDIANQFYKNTLLETFSRFRKNLSHFTFSQNMLFEKSAVLEDISKDLSTAKEVQDLFTTINTGAPDDKTDIGIKHSYIYLPCNEIGGDFINLIPLDNNCLSFIIADVSGHGVTAAMGTGVLKGTFTILLNELASSPSDLMFKLNNYYFEIMSKYYATCYYAFINMGNRTIKFAKAGHPHPLFWKSSDNNFIEINASGTGLGIIPDKHYISSEYSFSKGDKILFFTDGIIEQINSKGEMYSEKKLKETFSLLIDANSQDILSEIFEDLKLFSGDNKFEDDITIMLIEF